MSGASRDTDTESLDAVCIGLTNTIAAGESLRGDALQIPRFLLHSGGGSNGGSGGAKLIRMVRRVHAGKSKESRLFLVECVLEIARPSASDSDIGLPAPPTYHGLAGGRGRSRVVQSCVVKRSALTQPPNNNDDGAVPVRPITSASGGGGGGVFVQQAVVDAQCSIVGNWMLEHAKSPWYPSVYSVVTGERRNVGGGAAAIAAAPVRCVATVMQQLDGSLEELIKSGFFERGHDHGSTTTTTTTTPTKSKIIDWRRVAAMLCQVVFGVAQGNALASLVHNDLHAANVMYESVPEQNFLFYRFVHREGAFRLRRTLAVPTFGRVYKQIDFGRASFAWPATNVINAGAPPPPPMTTMVSDFWRKSFAQRHGLEATRPHTDLVRMAFEIEHLLVNDDGRALAARFNAGDAASALVHRLITSWTGVKGGGTIRSKLHTLGLADDSESEIRCFVWLPMLGQATNPCLCRPPCEYLEYFVPLFGIDDADVPSDAVVYEFVGDN